MQKLIPLFLACLMLAVFASPTFAEEAIPAGEAVAAATGDINAGLVKLGASLGAGLIMIGAAFGIGRIGGQAVEGMSRQPEAAGSIQTAMIISAALIEGATFFALIICLIVKHS